MTAATLPRRTRAVTAIGFGRLEGVLHDEAASPGFAARSLRGEELVEIDRRHLCPDPARAAEIGNARLGADAGAGEHNDALRLGEHTGERGGSGVVAHRATLAKPPG